MKKPSSWPSPSITFTSRRWTEIYLIRWLLIVSGKDNILYLSKIKVLTSYRTYGYITKHTITYHLTCMARYYLFYMEASEPKWVNPVLNIIGVNSLRLGGLHITVLITYIICDWLYNKNYIKINITDFNYLIFGTGMWI